MTTGSTIARFTITLSKSVADPVQVAWNTKDGTAKAGIDYAAASGTTVFSPGETNKDVDVLVYGRAVGTEDRNFFLEMTPPPNAILGESIGECIIYLDTAGNTAVIQVIVPTGPQGAKGDSAYQSWLNLGNTGTEQDFIDSLSDNTFGRVADAISAFDGALTGSAAETPVPSHSNPGIGPALNAQAQALLNRQEWFKQSLGDAGGLGMVGDLPKPITWEGLAGGAQGDPASNGAAITAANASGLTYMVPDGYWPNSVDATFNIYPGYRNYSGGMKLKRGLPGAGASNPYPLIWAEKTSNMKRVEGGTKWFDVAMQGALTLEPTATAFGVGVSGYIRSAAGDVLTVGKSVDAIGVHGSGKAVGRNGRVWGIWGQAGNGDDGSGVRSSQIVACELNLVNLFDSQPHPENLPAGEGPYRGLIVTTADGSKGCGIAMDVGDGSGRPAGESGWWIGLRLRREGVLPAGDWKNSYLEDTQQLKIEGSTSNLHRYGGIRLGPRLDGSGDNFTYGINTLGASFQDDNAINLDVDQRIYWGPVSGITKWIGYESETGGFNFRNMPLSINSTKVVGTRVTGFARMTGTPLKSSFNADTATLTQVAQRLKAIEDALHADSGHGLYGLT